MAGPEWMWWKSIMCSDRCALHFSRNQRGRLKNHGPFSTLIPLCRVEAIMKKISTRVFAVLLLVFLGTAGSLRAQIAYAVTGPNGTLVLHQMNGDGSGESTLAVPFNNPGFPTWSRDGLLLAFTASDPTNPVSRGQNVYAVSRASGAISQLTNYLDIV